jgi:hypothetical protein
MNQPAAYALKINGLSYADWEDEADRLRQVAARKGRILKRDSKRTQELLANLAAELEAIDHVLPGLRGLDAIRVQCTRDLVVALEASLSETLRRIEDRPSRRDPPLSQVATMISGATAEEPSEAS